MMKFAIVALLCGLVMPSSLIASDEEDMYKLLGGELRRPNTQVGRIVYVNCQKEVSPAIVKDVASKFEAELHFGIDIEEGCFELKNPKIVGNASLFIVNDQSLPALLVAPENRWAMVNLSEIAKSTDNPKLRDARATKEISRGMAFLSGAYLSQFNCTLMDYVKEPKDLDRCLDWRLPYDALLKMKKFLPRYGLTPFDVVSYRDACYEGWAPPPKDDIQRAIMKEERANRAKDDAESAKKTAK